ncbi:hypothetical protein F5Y16DRAFT_384326 [Xylariaceae sp. FL0255]|nr:hypothetical protein F5Y16DRAFT_384326 [Xylariaceae sp. FL0255]
MPARNGLKGAQAILAAPTTMRASTRSFSASAKQLSEAVAAPQALPVRKPVGAFRGGLFGFLLGTTLAGGGVYGYTLSVLPPLPPEPHSSVLDSARPSFNTILIS